MCSAVNFSNLYSVIRFKLLTSLGVLWRASLRIGVLRCASLRSHSILAGSFFCARLAFLPLSSLIATERTPFAEAEVLRWRGVAILIPAAVPDTRIAAELIALAGAGAAVLRATERRPLSKLALLRHRGIACLMTAAVRVTSLGTVDLVSGSSAGAHVLFLGSEQLLFAKSIAGDLSVDAFGAAVEELLEDSRLRVRIVRLLRALDLPEVHAVLVEVRIDRVAVRVLGNLPNLVLNVQQLVLVGRPSGSLDVALGLEHENVDLPVALNVPP